MINNLWGHIRFFRMTILIVLVILASVAVVTYVQIAVKRVEDELPLRVMQERRDMEQVARNFYDFLAVTDAAQALPTKGNLESVRENLRVVAADLQRLRDRYIFDTLIGASALHAALSPAVDDLQVWIEEGFNDLPPSSPIVLQLVVTRARETMGKVFDKTAAADRIAFEILERQSDELSLLRAQLMVPLVALVLMAAGMVWLASRHQRIAKRQAEAEAQTIRAQVQLQHAIESISEGFSLYDAEDRLVICNNRYHEQLYPGMSDDVKPGMSFEAVIRAAIERGLIDEVNDFESVDTWIENRLERHRNPSGSFFQRRGQQQWFQISERRTEDGGYVAVYTDITEIKNRERELAEKSRALEQLSNQLAKYLSPQVYDSIFSGKQEVKVTSSRKKLTVFFSDIADFTETADRLESEELTRLLNHYLTEMSQIALDHGATIDKYVGDAILIFFGDPESKGVKEDAVACVEMALAMRQRLNELANIWRGDGIEKPLKCRMGIHTGFCTVGNFGSENRLDYTIIGSAVNTASRLESLAMPGEIFISYETFAHVKELIHCEEHGKAEVKGIAYPVATYRVVDTFEGLDRQRRSFRAEHPAVKVELDLDAMTADDRERALETLRQAHALLSKSDIAG
jgi:class 3 adenylate cyclase